MTFELLPVRSSLAPGEAPEIEVRGLPAAGELRVLRLGEPVAVRALSTDGVVRLEPLPAGGYGIEAHAGTAVAGTAVARTAAARTAVARTAVARTAIEVGASGLRYGFVVDYRPGRDLTGLRDNIRRLHLTDIQFYDWAYRHADLLGGGEVYSDALDQPIALVTVRDLIATVHEAGARALGYTAVYGVGNAEWPRWSYAALLTPGGAPYGLGDFLSLVDPAEPGWLAHYSGELRTAAARLGFDGFHLDQYGYPKHAVRPDGTIVSVEDSFASVIAAVRAELPGARLVFNNVNNFPTWRTARSPQDAVYIEVWAPHTTLGHLAAVAQAARAAAPDKPTVIAAYQHVYDTASAAEADRATAFTMATLFSHGASHLLCGEADRILVDPYYVRNHVIEPSTAALLKRWYDFHVEHGELLTDPALADMTGALAGPYNDDCDVTYADTAVTESPVPGAVWRRVLGSGDRLVVHLINLCGQDDIEWDAPRKPVGEPAGGTLRIRRGGADLPRVRVADPDRAAALVDLPVTPDGDYAHATLPAPNIWQLLVIDLHPHP